MAPFVADKVLAVLLTKVNMLMQLSEKILVCQAEYRDGWGQSPDKLAKRACT